MLTTQEAAERLTHAGFKHTADEVAELARKEIFADAKKTRIEGGVWQIPVEDVDEFIRFRKLKRKRAWQFTGIAGLLLFIFAAISAINDSFELLPKLTQFSPSRHGAPLNITFSMECDPFRSPFCSDIAPDGWEPKIPAVTSTANGKEQKYYEQDIEDYGAGRFLVFSPNQAPPRGIFPDYASTSGRSSCAKSFSDIPSPHIEIKVWNQTKDTLS